MVNICDLRNKNWGFNKKNSMTKWSRVATVISPIIHAKGYPLLSLSFYFY